MVNTPNSVPPAGSGDPNAQKPNAKPKNTGTFQFTGEKHFLGMTFTPKDWNKLMNSMLSNFSSFINKTFQKATEKMKKDWARGEGKDVDD